MMIHAYAKLNLGDDLFIKMLCERYPETRFVLPAEKAYKECFRNQANLSVRSVEAIWLRAIKKVLKRFRSLEVEKLYIKWLALRCDGVVQIGGSVFMETPGWEEHLEWKREVYGRRKPYFILGANFGPWKDPAFLERHREGFAGCTDICFRDRHSFELFRDLGNVRVAPDIIFGYPVQTVPSRPELSSSAGRTAVLSVIRPSDRESLKSLDERYYDKFRDLSVALIEAGYRVVLMSFCEHEGDEEAAEAISARIPVGYADRVSCFKYRTNLDEAIACLAGADLIVATRFHAMILGWRFGKPVYPVAYSDKTLHVMDDARFSGGYGDLRHLEDMVPTDVVRSAETGRLNVSGLARRAEYHFERLDHYLGRSPGEEESAENAGRRVLAGRNHEN
ncbi:polysaccharide pyruvyl transferase family protein [Paenibacillus glufosinatiresistens]|uniref:polysaccharide pyruvyl transferase family protein n=1 Tax=Paenibacillus glufosinatiresistens TaxID=3070657 RepID=UPI00286E8E5C|nr:polysaccharide pyruvyl transferase family protein [Paenibacillus sp. YX.27]